WFTAEIGARNGDLISGAGPGLWQWRLLYLLSGRLLCPPTERRVGNSMLSADLVECDIGDGELLREMRHRLGPDKLVKFLAREDSGHGHPLFAMRGRHRPHALVKTPPPGTDPNV